ncbi:hypothetical protein [Streptomyces sp. NPDC001020]
MRFSIPLDHFAGPEHSVARAFTDGRTQTIHGGSTEITEEITGRSPLG